MKCNQFAFPLKFFTFVYKKNVNNMCLAIPGKIVEITEQEIAAFRTAKVNFDGIIKDVNLSMVPEAQVGNYVLVHVGLALNTIDEEEALKTLQLLKEMGEMNELNEGLS